ncbi:MAG: hypothetical protein WCT08_00385 [Patescibacteria group bacterium]|jgi:membrane protein DedA with SNARE-associated domain
MKFFTRDMGGLDKFSKVCSWLYIPWLILLIIWPDFRHALTTIAASGWGIVFLMLLAVIGNLIPGVPTNPAPILLGFAWIISPTYGIPNFAILVIATTAGSLFAYYLGRNLKTPNFVVGNNGFEAARDRFNQAKSKGLLIFTSRFWKSGGLGYINYRAGFREKPTTVLFTVYALLGHAIWVCLYFFGAYGIGKLLG